MNRALLCLLAYAFAFLVMPSAHSAPKATTLDDLKTLPINCLVPGWLPEGFHLKTVKIDYEDREGLKDEKTRGFPGYFIEYSDGKKGSFTLESARWGIGDRNLDQNDRAEESQFDTKVYGPVYIIYFPPGKAGVKQRITANWVADPGLKAEAAKNANGLPVKSRYHGVSGFGMTLPDYEKIVRSLHPIREKAP